ncbi:MAG: PAS domain S-box protein, partial [Prolixibacteraceae bacterium]|nr:PAS domain S-box protein [Prolixibacteraceae bacterium]
NNDFFRVACIRDITERKRAEKIRQLQYNIARAMISTRNLNELFDSVKVELNKLIDAKNFVVAFYNEETGMLNSLVNKDEKDDIGIWPAKKSLTGYTIEQNRPVLLQKNEILRLHNEGIIDLIGTVSEAWLGVPLKIEGKILGAVVVQNFDNRDAYNETSIEIMELAAHELSLFIDRQLTEEKAWKLSRAIEQSPVSVIITNRKGLIEYTNPFFTELTGYRFEEVKGKNPNIFRSGHHTTAFYKDFWDTILLGHNWEGEFLNKKKNGELYWANAVVAPIVNSDGVITNFVSIKEDITQRKKMIEELVVAKEKAQESDKLKSAFLANMSHEIRTPMNGILGFLELLQEPDLEEKEKTDYINIVNKSGERLLSTINDIIEISKIESGDIQITRQEIKLLPFLSHYHGFFLSQAKEKGLQLKIVHCKNAPATIYADKTKLHSILSNLIKNAIKFTDHGSVEFGCNLHTDNDLRFYVKDTGKGIDPEKQNTVFGRFVRADISLSSGYEGAGLGLSITKGYVEALGGSIWIESEPGKGSCFYFTIPVVKEKQKQ